MMNKPSPPTTFQSALVVDDHPLFCDALSMTLQTVAGIGRIDSAATLQEAIEWLQGHDSPDVIVLDLNLPDVNGLEGVIRMLKVTSAPIVVVSSMADNRVISSVIHAGAAGFVPKHSQRAVFRAAFEDLARGEVFVPPGYDLLENDEAVPQNDAVKRLASLTNQQARILQLICEGKLNKQIAFDLSIAETTVKAHVTAIMRKLGVQSRTQAVLIAKETSFGSVLSDRI
ncbi:response regulator [Sedimentitalea sp. XS_ASV28]|uniref:response regulator n=1 Tax=Sedimentitalea sp. XS_ASV28 TaxID=3241296 RepID=UPI003517EDED